jgi:hypothetical protein
VLARWCLQIVDARELAGGEVKVESRGGTLDWRLPIRIKTSLAAGLTTFGSSSGSQLSTIQS